LNWGIDLRSLSELYGKEYLELFRPQIAELVQTGLVTEEDGFLRLTERGRLLSNEVFSRFLLD
jgi:oxygen-independent coproporphyrinogen-3 oxidase